MSELSSIRATIVIPCYNEAERLDVAQVETLLADARVHVLLVDDGSTDGTLAMLQTLADANPRVEAFSMPCNGGKAEAVRVGLNHALGAIVATPETVDVVGYADADFATPASEIIRLVDELERSGVSVAMGSRVARLGADIVRSRVRHYLGRVFASLASVILNLPVYDTQCGAKVFKDLAVLRRALSHPFASRWIFDVELIGRLMDPRDGDALSASDFLEMPLLRWHDVGGSKLGATAMLKAGWALLKLGWTGPARGESASD
jgi:dolichyl-phosphate beta-glucosyltransferase